MKVPLKRCQQFLALLWICGGGALFAIVFAQTIGGRFGDGSQDAWGWLLPTVVPTLSLIVTVLFKTSEAELKMVDRFLFRLCFSLSLAYLIAVLAVLLSLPLQPTTNPLDVLKSSNIYLGPFQGLVASSLGVFFGQVKATRADKDDSETIAASAS